MTVMSKIGVNVVLGASSYANTLHFPIGFFLPTLQNTYCCLIYTSIHQLFINL